MNQEGGKDVVVAWFEVGFTVNPQGNMNITDTGLRTDTCAQDFLVSKQEATSSLERVGQFERGIQGQFSNMNPVVQRFKRHVIYV